MDQSLNNIPDLLRELNEIGIALSAEIIDKDEKMTALTLPKVEMPNQDGFINIYEMETTHQ
jgi:hypothetical protein